jgi:hypothetical protein
MVVPPPNPAPPAAAPLDSYTVKASLIRDSNGVESNIASTTPLAASDHLALRVQASRDVYLYLMNADDAGETYRLFPLSGHTPTNPIGASTTHRLPGRDLNWVVTSSGGREHFLVIVTPTLDPELEAKVRDIPEASENRPVRRARLGDDAIGVLRGVGGLSKRPSTTAGVKSLPWFDGAEELTGAVETTSGAWMRRLTVPGSSR